MVISKSPGYVQIRPLTERNIETDKEDPTPLLDATKKKSIINIFRTLFLLQTCLQTFVKHAAILSGRAVVSSRRYSISEIGFWQNWYETCVETKDQQNQPEPQKYFLNYWLCNWRTTLLCMSYRSYIATKGFNQISKRIFVKPNKVARLPLERTL